MLKSKLQDIVYFTVRETQAGKSGVYEHGYDIALAEFNSMDDAEQYALRMAESKLNWKVDVYDESGVLAATYNSEDDTMPAPVMS
jgi:hypothetical protein